MATFGALREAVDAATKTLEATKRRLADADVEADTLNRGLVQLAADRTVLIDKLAAGADVEKELADNRGWQEDGTKQLDTLEELPRRVAPRLKKPSGGFSRGGG